MKSIIIYSGKGGVGKTTTTASLAKSLVGQGKKVFILDADVNTPSMNSIFPNPEPSENLQVRSLGYSTDGMIFIQSSLIRSYISDSVKMIKKFKPDFVLIDTPPSITDVHLNLISSIQTSGVIMVTQPTAISESDVRRTALFFNSKDLTTLGLIENMSLNDEKTYDINLLGRISFIQGFDFDKIYEANKEKYDKITESILNVDDVILEIQKERAVEQTLTVDDIERNFSYCRESEKMKFLHFYNVETWDWVRDKILDMPFVGMDERIHRTTPDIIERMLEHFDGDNEAFFMITMAPQTEIPLLTGEIGQGTLFYPEPDKYYGVPRIKYKTKHGEVQLFPDEIHPMSLEDIQAYVNEGYVLTNDGRYIPTLEHLKMVYNAFGERVGIHKNYEKTFKFITSQKEIPLSVYRGT